MRPLTQASNAFTAEKLSLVWGGQEVTQAASEIFIPSEKERALGEQVARTLGCPQAIVKVAAAQTIGVQASVRLAADSTFTTPSPTPPAVGAS